MDRNARKHFPPSVQTWLRSQIQQFESSKALKVATSQSVSVLATTAFYSVWVFP